MTSVGQIEIQLTYIVVFTLDAKKNKPRLLEFTYCFLVIKKLIFLKPGAFHCPFLRGLVQFFHFWHINIVKSTQTCAELAAKCVSVCGVRCTNMHPSNRLPSHAILLAGLALFAAIFLLVSTYLAADMCDRAHLRLWHHTAPPEEFSVRSATNKTIFHTFQGRLGNQLFQMASIVGIARENWALQCFNTNPLDHFLQRQQTLCVHPAPACAFRMSEHGNYATHEPFHVV